jgi:hypothetical protein
MRNLLALGALALLVFLGLGWYLGWYRIQSTPTADGHRQINIDLNTNKIKTDVSKGEQEVHDILNKNTPNTNPTTPGQSTSFTPGQDGSFVFPGNSPTPPSGGPTLPSPR